MVICVLALTDSRAFQTCLFCLHNCMSLNTSPQSSEGSLFLCTYSAEAVAQIWFSHRIWRYVNVPNMLWPRVIMRGCLFVAGLLLVLVSFVSLRMMKENDERSSDGNYFQILLCSYCELSPLTQITISHQSDCDQKPQTTRVSVKTLLQLYSNFVFEKYLPSLWLPLLTQTPPITHKHIYSDKHRSTTSQHADRWEALFNFLKGNHSISQKAN